MAAMCLYIVYIIHTLLPETFWHRFAISFMNERLFNYRAILCALNESNGESVRQLGFYS